MVFTEKRREGHYDLHMQ